MRVPLLIVGECASVMAGMPEASVDAIVTDPPYGLGFMHKAWDKEVPSSWISDALRVLKPGGHLLAFGGTRTYHRLTCAMEDSGFEIRDCLMWLYGQGFPKSLDVGKAIDKAAGARRKVVGKTRRNVGPAESRRVEGMHGSSTFRERPDNPGNLATEPATDAARQWDGWGTALKPSWEPIVMARKPLVGTVAANVQQHGTGAINVAGCRLEGPGGQARIDEPSQDRRYTERGSTNFAAAPGPRGGDPTGRWPPNVALSHTPDCKPVGTRAVRSGTAVNRNRSERLPSATPIAPSKVQPDDVSYAGADGLEQIESWDCAPGCPVGDLDAQSGELVSGANPERRNDGMFKGIYQPYRGSRDCNPLRGADRGGASRFFYVAKASTEDRSGESLPLFGIEAATNTHPTVKPTELMRWLVRMVTPPGGLVLDPFCGSGTTGIACQAEGFRCVLIERQEEYAQIAARRVGVR